MFRLIRTLSRRPRPSRTPRRAAGPQVRLEELEPRLVPSAAAPGAGSGDRGPRVAPPAAALSSPPSRGPAGVAVAFSADERSVSVQADGRDLTFSRPVVSPWNYQPAGTVYWVATTGSDLA